MAICYKCRRLIDACRCPKQKEVRRNAEERKPYKTKRWQNVRKLVLRRDLGLCQMCGEPGNEVDHIQRAAHHQHLFYDLSNLQVLCKPCHSRKTKQEGRL